MNHLKKNNISYTKHFFRGISFALWCLKMCTICLIHSILPFTYEDTFSKEVKKLSSKLKNL